jgi:hypothetical protein
MNRFDGICVHACGGCTHFVNGLSGVDLMAKPKTVKDLFGTPDDAVRLGTNPRTQMIVCAVLLLPVAVAFLHRHEVGASLFACVVPLMLTGTFRTSFVGEERFTTRFHVAFVPVSVERCNLRAVTSVMARFAWDGPGVGTILLFGPSQFLFGWLFEILIPALGGPYQIHLVTAKGRELVAWRGFVDAHFQKTLQLLTNATHAEVRSM